MSINIFFITFLLFIVFHYFVVNLTFFLAKLYWGNGSCLLSDSMLSASRSTSSSLNMV